MRLKYESFMSLLWLLILVVSLVLTFVLVTVKFQPLISQSTETSEARHLISNFEGHLMYFLFAIEISVIGLGWALGRISHIWSMAVESVMGKVGISFSENERVQMESQEFKALTSAGTLVLILGMVSGAIVLVYLQSVAGALSVALVFLLPIQWKLIEADLKVLDSKDWFTTRRRLSKYLNYTALSIGAAILDVSVALLLIYGASSLLLRIYSEYFFAGPAVLDTRFRGQAIGLLSLFPLSQLFSFLIVAMSAAYLISYIAARRTMFGMGGWVSVVIPFFIGFLSASVLNELASSNLDPLLFGILSVLISVSAAELFKRSLERHFNPLCPKCGERVPITSRFCPSCGEGIRDATQSS